MLVNALSGAVFAYYFGIAGLGMGLAFATTVQAVLLLRWMLPQLESWVWSSLVRSTGKCLVAALIMGVPAYFGAMWFPYARSSLAAAGLLGVIVVLGALVYLFFGDVIIARWLPAFYLIGA